MTNWYSPKFFREKKQTNTPLLQPIPQGNFFTKNGNIPRGWFLGWPPWRQPSAMKSFLSWFIGRWMDVFFSLRAKKTLATRFLLIQKKSYRTNNWSYQPSSQDGFVASDPTFFFFQTQSAEAGGSKLSGVARGKDRSCGAKVSSRA